MRKLPVRAGAVCPRRNTKRCIRREGGLNSRARTVCNLRAARRPPPRLLLYYTLGCTQQRAPVAGLKCKFKFQPEISLKYDYNVNAISLRLVYLQRLEVHDLVLGQVRVTEELKQKKRDG